MVRMSLLILLVEVKLMVFKQAEVQETTNSVVEDDRVCVGEKYPIALLFG